MKRYVSPMVAISMVLTGAVVSSASAEESDSIGQVASLVQAVAPDQGAVIVPDEISGDVVATAVGRVQVEIPVDAEAPISVGARNAVAPPLEVTLPAEVNVGEGQVATDGTVVFEGVGGGADAAVQVLEDGSVRAQTITRDETGPHEFTYVFGDDTFLIEGQKGEIEVIQDLGEGVAVTVGVIDEAWATDAEGRDVETGYRSEDNALVQYIEPTEDASYPIVADPKVTSTWWNTTVYFNRKETRRIGDGASVAALVGSVVPNVIVKAMGFLGSALAATALIIHNEGKCLKFVYYGNIANVWQPYWGNEAGGYCR